MQNSSEVIRSPAEHDNTGRSGRSRASNQIEEVQSYFDLPRQPFLLVHDSASSGAGPSMYGLMGLGNSAAAREATLAASASAHPSTAIANTDSSASLQCPWMRPMPNEDRAAAHSCSKHTAGRPFTWCKSL